MQASPALPAVNTVRVHLPTDGGRLPETTPQAQIAREERSCTDEASTQRLTAAREGTLAFLGRGWGLCLPPILCGHVSRAGAGRPCIFSQSENQPARVSLTGHANVVHPAVERQQTREFYLKGRYFWNQRTGGSLQRARDEFMRAIVLNSAYAEA